MGSGKTTLAQTLSSTLSIPWIDTDVIIEETQKSTISELFKVSESHFRSIESSICFQLKDIKNSVISTGGGIVLNSKNREILKSLGLVVFLDVSLNTVLSRLQDDESRPLLRVSNREKVIQSLLDERRALYEETASLTIETDTRTIHDISDMIIEKLNHYD
ncbi:shikimate kinase [Candidatus Marinamargulisbacteria bacterium SCGC AG-343-D04]|nr:shikimate kinase [Candidatus Marinamargulisbacteria bacterium SCGC AG-343-D04]